MRMLAGKYVENYKIESVIYFKSEEALALYAQELIGQLSDGLWENSWISSEYRFFTDAKLVLKPNEEVGYVNKEYYRPAKKFDFTTKILRECIGDRMLNIINNTEMIRPFIDSDGNFNSEEFYKSRVGRKMEKVSKKPKYQARNLSKFLKECNEATRNNKG